jgi:predicted  nucleic acid-binding Zn-ribbon protein
MNNLLSALIKLQDFDLALDALRKKGEAMALEKERLNAEIQNLKVGLETAKSALTQLQLRKKQLELEIDGKDSQVKKFQGELNSVKTNDTYKALLKEIEQAKAGKNSLEEDLLGVLQNLEDAQKDIKVREQTHRTQEQAIQAEITSAERAVQDLKAQMDEKRQLRDSFAAEVPEAPRSRYDTMRQSMGGSAVVVPIRVNTCGGCRQKLPLHLINDVRKDQLLVACDSCARILFLEQPTPTANPII